MIDSLLIIRGYIYLVSSLDVYWVFVWRFSEIWRLDLVLGVGDLVLSKVSMIF